MSKSNKLILGKCEYDPELRELTVEGQPSQVIGHVQAKLLQLLYSNPDQYFSNDDLQREVWDGRIIENTTIRTTVSYLRKALGESEDCKYIDSGRNKGYRFVAEIEEITPQRQLKQFFPFAVIAGLALLLVYVVFQSAPPQALPQIETTLVGQERGATVSGELMVFTHKPEGSKYWNLYSKQIGKERYSRLTKGEFNEKNITLSEDGERIAFNRDDGKKCQVIVADISKVDQKLSNEEIVFTCKKESNLVSIAWQNQNNLYLSLAKTMSDKFSLLLFDIKTKESRAITSPVTSGRGDYFVTTNNTTKKIAYLRNIIGNKTEVWIYDELTTEAKKLISIPMILMSTDWINSSELIVRTGWGQLSRLNINSGKLQTILQINDSISFPFTISGSSVGYMKGFLSVRDIIQIDANGTKSNVISSSFRDYNPVYAETGESIAFISNRTGKYQIWIRNKNGELSQITHFKKNLRIDNLTISPDGKYIAFEISAHLQVMKPDGTLLFKSKEQHLNKNPVFSPNSDRLYYSSNIDGAWHITYRSMASLEEKNELTEGYVIVPCSEKNCFYFIKNKESLLYKSQEGLEYSTGVNLSNIVRPDQITIVNELVYYLKREGNKSNLFVQNMDTKEVSSVMPLSTSRFFIQQNPFRVLTSISRETETLLQSITISD